MKAVNSMILYFILFCSCSVLNNPYEKGLKLFENESFELAIKEFSLSIKQNPENEHAFYYRARCKQELGDTKGAINDFDKAIKINSKFGESYLNRGISKAKLKNYKGALVDLNYAIKSLSNSTDENDLFNLAAAYNNRGLLKRTEFELIEESIEDFDKSAELAPKFYRSYFNKAIANRLLKNFDTALNDINQAIMLDSSEYFLYFERALTKGDLKKHSEAIEDFSKSIDLNPAYGYSYNNRGLEKVKLENYEEAIEDYSIAIESKLNNKAYSLNNRGYAYFKLGKFENALEDCNNSLALDPENSWVHFNLGLINYQLGEKTKGCEFLHKSKALGKEDAAAAIEKYCIK